MKKEVIAKSHHIAHIASLTCLVHCIVAPFLVVFSPLMGHLFHNHFIEIGFLAFSLLCGIYVITKGYCQHKRKHIVFLYSVGALFWILHSTLSHSHMHHGDTLFLIIGSLFVVGSYYFNHKLLKCCPESH